MVARIARFKASPVHGAYVRGLELPLGPMRSRWSLLAGLVLLFVVGHAVNRVAFGGRHQSFADQPVPVVRRTKEEMITDGDQVLTEIGHILSGGARESDFLVRYGGDLAPSALHTNDGPTAVTRLLERESTNA